MTTRRLLLYFPKSETEKPIVYHLVKDYGLVINIFRAKVTPDEYGYLVLDVTGQDADIERGLEFVRGFNVQIDDAMIGCPANGDRPVWGLWEVEDQHVIAARGERSCR